MIEIFAWSITVDADAGCPALIVVSPAAIPDPVADGGESIGPEARDRVRAAVLNSAQTYPQAGLRVYRLSQRPLGSLANLATAIAVIRMEATDLGHVDFDRVVFLAELGLDGSLRPTASIPAAVQTAAHLGFACAVVPAANLADASTVAGIGVLAAQTLTEVLTWLRGPHTVLSADADAEIELPPAL